jgi:hypothetical protein
MKCRNMGCILQQNLRISVVSPPTGRITSAATESRTETAVQLLS